MEMDEGKTHTPSGERDDEFDYDDNDCANCGGEGFTYGCSWDWQCDTYDEGEGTCLCTRRCDWCNPAPMTETDIALRKVLGEALSLASPSARSSLKKGTANEQSRSRVAGGADTRSA